MIFESLNGKEAKKTGKELAYEHGIKVRDVVKMVQKERLQGKPICASQNYYDCGYYIGTAADIERQTVAIENRIKSLQKVNRALKKTARRLRKNES